MKNIGSKKNKKSFVNTSLISFKKENKDSSNRKDGRRSKNKNIKDRNKNEFINKDDKYNRNKNKNQNKNRNRNQNNEIDFKESRENNNEFILDSISSFKEYLKYDPSSILEIKCLASLKDKIVSIMKEYGRADLENKIKLQNKDFLSDSVEDTSSSEVFPLSVKVKVDTFDIDDLIRDLKEKEKAVVIACDHITDPRNLGAIIRSAAFFGVSYIIIPEYRQTPITSTVVSTSMGGLSLVKVVSVVNMGMSLEKLKEEGFWIVGTDMEGEDFKKVAGFYEKVVLVLGSEDKGISRIVKDKCDRMVSIPSFSDKRIDSLNVSVATGILIEAFKRV